MQRFRDVLSSWKRGRYSQLEAAELLGCSERTFRRWVYRFEEEGAAGLADRRLGKPSPKAIGAGERERVLALYRARHQGWTAKHFHDHGVRDHAFSWGFTWTKTQLHSAGLVDKAPRRGAHRRKRERKPCEGMMPHQDGSRHVWIEGLPAMDLIVTMDDATSVNYSAFLIEEEGTQSTLRGLLDVFTAHGLPCALFTDRSSHSFTTPEAGGKVDKVHVTQVGRALSHLGVEHIAAYSPEARGPSERMFGTLQDRLVKELALAGIRTAAAANAWIDAVYIAGHNRVFATQPMVSDCAFVAVDRATLVETLCIEGSREHSRLGRAAPADPRQRGARPLRQGAGEVRQSPDDTLAIFHGPRCIGRFDADGTLQPTEAIKPTIAAAARVAACSTASRDGLAAAEPVAAAERRPRLTRSARVAIELPSRKSLECTA